MNFQGFRVGIPVLVSIVLISVFAFMQTRPLIEDRAGREEVSPDNTQWMIEGVLKIRTDNFNLRYDTVAIENKDGTTFAKIYSTSNDEPQIQGTELDWAKKIRAYYPEYYIILFDVKKRIGESFEVLIGTESKFIKNQPGVFVQYLSWEKHIRRSFLLLTSKNELYLKAGEEGTRLQLENVNLEDYSFIVTDVNGDWTKVKCDRDCEGCLSAKELEGWVKWKEGNQLLVEIRYAC